MLDWTTVSCSSSADVSHASWMSPMNSDETSPAMPLFGAAQSVVTGAEAKGQRLDRVLSACLPAISRSRLQALIRDGQVRSDGIIRVDPGFKLRGGETLILTVPPPAAAEPLGEAIPLTVLHEDAHLIVIDKPAGL